MSYQIIKAEIPKINRDKRFRPDSPQKIAARNGLVHFQGAICRHGHSGLRYTKGSQCIECMGLARGKVITPNGRSIKNHELSLEAAANGRTVYEPSSPCKNGHLLRFVNSNNCVECDKAANQKHKLSAKYARIKKEYGLSKENYLELVRLQDSRCKICNKYEPDRFKLHIDHCHDTKLVRALLCGTCNQAIGMLRHDPELIRKAALYCEQS